jgi:5-methyltetrahydropteroyltriglutamate--homocysteine methyltransferase
MARAGPPFRADQVGSLLRSRALAAARARRERNEITAQRLKAIEDEEIRLLIEKQEAAGLQSITDGEYRRAWWHFDFMERLQGVEGFQAEQGIQFHGTMTKPRGVRVVGKIGFGGHPFLEHFKFLKAHTTRTPKMTIPGPPVLHFRLGRRNISTRAYPDIDLYFDDLGKTYRKVVQAFYDAGCRYLQLDDTVWAYLCSKAELQKARDLHGNIVDRLPEIYARTINDALAGKPADMMITTHVCRGNFRSTWVSEGGYEPVAELLFGSVNYDGYFLEYDTDRAGDFKPLRFVPKGKTVILGLVSTKTPELEKKDELKRRIEDAAKYCPLEQLGLSPQCGFSSGGGSGQVMTEDATKQKLALIVEVAREVWGSA